MINYYDKHRFISKRQLAEYADVSPRTFARYLATRRHILEAMGIPLNAQKLPPQTVRYICEDYCIDLPPELQYQKALAESPIRNIIIDSWQAEQAFLKTRKKKNVKKQINSNDVGQSPPIVFCEVVPLHRQ